MTDKAIRCPLCGMYDTNYLYIAPPDPKDHRVVIEVHACNKCNDKFKVYYQLSKCAPVAAYRSME